MLRSLHTMAQQLSWFTSAVPYQYLTPYIFDQNRCTRNLHLFHFFQSFPYFIRARMVPPDDRKTWSWHLGTITLSGCPSHPWTMARIQTHVIEDPSAPKACAVPLYHGGLLTTDIKAIKVNSKPKPSQLLSINPYDLPHTNTSLLYRHLSCVVKQSPKEKRYERGFPSTCKVYE